MCEIGVIGVGGRYFVCIQNQNIARKKEHERSEGGNGGLQDPQNQGPFPLKRCLEMQVQSVWNHS